MKIIEFAKNKIKEDQEFFDLAANLRRTPEEDKQAQFVGGSDKRKPTLTLRHINQLKKMKSAQREEQEKRHKLLGLMYSAPVAEEE